VRACASVAETPVIAAGAVVEPVVLVDHVAEPRLHVASVSKQGPLDQRKAILTTDSGADTDRLMAQWRDATVTVALPLRLVDDQLRWPVLVEGQISGVDSEVSAGEQKTILEVSDRWNQQLNRQIETTWWQIGDALLVDRIGDAEMRSDELRNRSESPWLVEGSEIYVLQIDGHSWTVQTAIDAISVLAGLDLSTQLIPRDIAIAPLLQPADLSKPVGRALEQVLTSYGLIVQRTLVREGHRLVEHRSVRPKDCGRSIHLAWADDDRALGQVIRTNTNTVAPLARPWIARAKGWQVESTFTLVPGWDPSLEGQSDATYSRADNAEFATYANVYRLWVLNEDGAFTAAPYNQGEAYDLSSLFGQEQVRPQPLVFADCLVLDDAGQKRGPIVEMSSDGGSQWTVYPGIAVIAEERAAVYLDDTTLPAAFLSAAKTGDARIRVTGSLQCPVPVQVMRWHGNPFLGTQEAEIRHVGDAFGFRRVDSGSTHYAQVISGAIQADEADETDALQAWLTARMRQASQGEVDGGIAHLSLAGIWPLLHIGDHLINTTGRDIDVRQRPEAVTGAAATIRSVTCRWARGPYRRLRRTPPVTELELQI